MATPTPTPLFTLHGVTYYEHPLLGDESAMLIKVDGVWCETDFYDRPDDGEARELAEQLKRGGLNMCPFVCAVNFEAAQ